MNIEDFRPEYVGRGQWHVLHTLASNAKTQKERDSLVWVLNTVVNNLRCLICYKHATKYLKDNWRSTIAYDQGELFLFLYNFHKSANLFAGKTSPSFEEVKSFYYENTERCTLTCGQHEEVRNYI